MLKSLNDKFINSSTKTKIELFLLPILLLFLLSFYSFEGKIDEIETTPKNSFDEFSNKKFSGSYLEILTLLENLAKKNGITILTDEKDKESILLKGKAQKIALETFIQQIENINNFSKIDSLILNKIKESEEYFFDLKIDFSKFYFKQIKKLDSLEVEEKPLEKILQKEKNFVENSKFEINAIADIYALINGNLVELGEEIDGYKLVELQMYFVILENENEKIKLEIDHGEYFKNFN